MNQNTFSNNKQTKYIKGIISFKQSADYHNQLIYRTDANRYNYVIPAVNHWEKLENGHVLIECDRERHDFEDLIWSDKCKVRNLTEGYGDGENMFWTVDAKHNVHPLDITKLKHDDCVLFGDPQSIYGTPDLIEDSISDIMIDEKHRIYLVEMESGMVLSSIDFEKELMEAINKLELEEEPIIDNDIGIMIE